MIPNYVGFRKGSSDVIKQVASDDSIGVEK